MKMGVLVLVLSVICVATLFSSGSFALTEDGKVLFFILFYFISFSLF